MHLAFLYPQLKKLTGAQRLILRLAQYTVAAGVPVTLVTHHLSDEPRDALASGVSLVETGRQVDYTGNHYADAALEYGLAPALIKHIPKSCTAVIGFGPPTMPAIWWAKHRKRDSPPLPLLAFLYEPPRFVDRDRRDVVTGLGAAGNIVQPFLVGYRQVDRQLVRAADTLLANSTYGANRLREAYGRDATVIPHGVDFMVPSGEAITEARTRYHIPPEAPLLLSVNQLHPRKRLDLFIRVLAAVRQHHPTARGLLVGRGIDEERLRSEARLRGVTEALTFTGFVPDADLAALYHTATVYLHTGRDETFGLSVLEAAWSGLPVVAVDEGGPREILANADGDAVGSLVPATVNALTAAVLNLLCDTGGTRQRAMRVQTSVRARYSWEAGAHALIEAVERTSAAHATHATGEKAR